MPQYFLKGILIGIIFGVPAGAIGALTIQRTLEKGVFAGFFTGMGSSAADLLYSAVGVLGITAISDFLSKYQRIMQTIGGLMIALLGIIILQKKDGLVKTQGLKKGNLAMCFGSAFVTAILNPATVLSFLLAFTAFGITGKMAPAEGGSLMLGILLGTLLWWLALSGIVAVLRNKITDKIYHLLNLILGFFMEIFGGIMIIRSIIL